jgi:phage/plasmid-like protein (TIGR03299 family)
MGELLVMNFENRRAIWDGVGQPVKGSKEVTEALIKAGLNFKVNKEEVYVQDKLVKNWVANVRSDNGNVLGMVSPQYKIVQNDEAFGFVDELLGEGVELTAGGTCRGGKAVWMLGELDGMKILGDDVKPHLVFTNTHDGKGAVRISVVPLRIWCQNQLNFSFMDATGRKAERKWSIIHMGDVDKKIAAAKETIQKTQIYMRELNKFAEKTVGVGINDRQVLELINELFPVNMELVDNRASANALLRRDELMSRYVTAPDLKKFRNTVWGVLNAIADYTSHAEPGKETATYRERLFEKVVGGHPMMDKAVRLLGVA